MDINSVSTDIAHPVAKANKLNRSVGIWNDGSSWIFS